MSPRRRDKKQKAVQSVVREVISAYEENGRNADPLGMYTGVTREVRETPDAYHMASYPDIKTPTDAILDGKKYRPEPVCRADAEPVQDADDL